MAALKVNPPLGRMPVLQFLRPDEMQIDAAYQRSIAAAESQALIKRIAQYWNWDLCQPLVVSRRGAQELFVIDGQHRLEAARLRGDIANLPCVVVEYDSAAHEAASFVELNQQRRPLNALDLFRAALASGDSEARAIMAAIEKAGLSLAKHSNYTAWKPGEISIIGGVRRYWKRTGAGPTAEALQVLGNAWPDTIQRYAGTLFPGICTVIAAEMRGHDRLPPASFATFTARLGARSQADWRKDILARRALQPEMDQGSVAAMVMREVFDGKAAPPPPRLKPNHGVAETGTAGMQFAPDGKGEPELGSKMVNDGLAWCEQCDERRSENEARQCKSRFCPFWPGRRAG